MEDRYCVYTPRSCNIGQHYCICNPNCENFPYFFDVNKSGSNPFSFYQVFGYQLLENLYRFLNTNYQITLFDRSDFEQCAIKTVFNPNVQLYLKELYPKSTSNIHKDFISDIFEKIRENHKYIDVIADFTEFLLSYLAGVIPQQKNREISTEQAFKLLDNFAKKCGVYVKVYNPDNLFEPEVLEVRPIMHFYVTSRDWRILVHKKISYSNNIKYYSGKMIGCLYGPNAEFETERDELGEIDRLAIRIIKGIRDDLKQNHEMLIYIKELVEGRPHLIKASCVREYLESLKLN